MEVNSWDPVVCTTMGSNVLSIAVLMAGASVCDTHSFVVDSYLYNTGPAILIVPALLSSSAHWASVKVRLLM